MNASFTHAQFEAVLDREPLDIGAGELHGLLTGYLCGGGHAEGQQRLEALELASGDASADRPLAAFLDRAGPWCRERLDDTQLGFEPLLPADCRPLTERADAMMAWTRGFLGGFGLAGVRDDALSDDAREVLRDFDAVAASQPVLGAAEGPEAEEDESALMELVEFLRVGAMLLRTEIAGARRTGGSTA